MDDVIGWDIGGAHLKGARLDGHLRTLKVVQIPCPLWHGLDVLEHAIDQAVVALGHVACHAVTMTGELADIFSSRQEGVVMITQTIEEKFSGSSLNLFAGKQGFVPGNRACDFTEEIASANWVASAQFTAKKIANGIFVDVGSTTTDVIALRNGLPRPVGMTDARRLATDELIYTGVVRTPVMAVSRRLTFQGQSQRVMAEHFATMADVYRLTGQLEPLHDMAETADGAGKTAMETARRLARMVGRDAEEASMSSWLTLAEEIATIQRQDIRHAIEAVMAAQGVTASAPLVGAGAGRFVVQQLADEMGCGYIDFADLVEGATEERVWSAVCAPAYSVAWLRAQSS